MRICAWFNMAKLLPILIRILNICHIFKTCFCCKLGFGASTWSVMPLIGPGVLLLQSSFRTSIFSFVNTLMDRIIFGKPVLINEEIHMIKDDRGGKHTSEGMFGGNEEPQYDARGPAKP